jgi:hypothetical protein
VNGHGGFGRWAFIEIDDPWNSQNLIRTRIATSGAPGSGFGMVKSNRRAVSTDFYPVSLGES